MLHSARLDVLDKSEMCRERLLTILQKLDKQYEPSISDLVELEDYATKLWGSAVNIVAEVDGNDIGFISFYANNVDSKQAYISSIGMDRAYWGSGLGRRLLLAAEDIARDRRMTTIKLEVSLNNLRAIHFYNKMGFNPINKDGGSSKMESTFMIKPLV